jgi:dihydrofolate reductase
MKPYFKGEVLPGRLKYVLTRDEGASIDGAIAVSLETAIELGKRNTVYVIGGGEIYNLFLQWADELFLTRVHTQIEETDETVFFPIGIEGFDLIESTPIVTTAFSFDFELWARSHE